MEAITLSNLRTRANELKEALKRGERIQLTSHGKTIGIIVPSDKSSQQAERAAALEAFFEAGSSSSLQDELARVARGRKGRSNAV